MENRDGGAFFPFSSIIFLWVKFVGLLPLIHDSFVSLNQSYTLSIVFPIEKNKYLQSKMFIRHHPTENLKKFQLQRFPNYP